MAGGDAEDLIQEGMIGVVKAISRFNPEKDTSFKTFAFTCIKNKLYSAIKNAAGSKHSPLNNYIPFEVPLFYSDDDFRGANSIAIQTTEDPVEQIIGRKAFKELSQTLEGILSRFELQVLNLYLEGLSYSEISEKTLKPQKSVDNAVQRIRRKFASHILKGNIR